jgi:hypothetical protein
MMMTMTMTMKMIMTMMIMTVTNVMVERMKEEKSDEGKRKENSKGGTTIRKKYKTVMVETHTISPMPARQIELTKQSIIFLLTL